MRVSEFNYKESRNPGRIQEESMSLEHEALTEKIIGAAIEVHKRLGLGFLESIYEKSLIIELKKRGLLVEYQRELPIYYDGVEVGQHRLDLFVANTIIVELKAIKNLEDVHFAIARSYLKAAGQKQGLILNFASQHAKSNA
jgi:GxxExxY protein